MNCVWEWRVRRNDMVGWVGEGMSGATGGVGGVG